jgi:ABC-type Zn uptake system ZnuABC Zn-binding protein ZnuA
MNTKLGFSRRAMLAGLALLAAGAVMPGCKNEGSSTAEKTGKVKAVATTPDLGAIMLAVGGNDVDVTTFVKGGNDPHVVEANTGMVESLSKAEILAVVGLHVEDGWLPGMLRTAGNKAVMRDGAGYVSLSKTARLISEGAEEEAKEAKPKEKGKAQAQSFHPDENPHFLLDPVEGVKAAKVLSQKLAEARPKEAAAFEARYREFAKEIMTIQLGQALADKLTAEDFEPVSIAIEKGTLPKYLEDKKIKGVELGGLAAEIAPYKGAHLAGDHDLWPYFARRYGVEMIGYIEGHPGEMPNAQHMTDLMAKMKVEKAALLLRAPYFDAKQTKFVADGTGAKVVEMAHLPGARAGTESYADFIKYNARQLLDALKTTKP